MCYRLWTTASPDAMSLRYGLGHLVSCSWGEIVSDRKSALPYVTVIYLFTIKLSQTNQYVRYP